MVKKHFLLLNVCSSLRWKLNQKHKRGMVIQHVAAMVSAQQRQEMVLLQSRKGMSSFYYLLFIPLYCNSDMTVFSKKLADLGEIFHDIHDVFILSWASRNVVLKNWMQHSSLAIHCMLLSPINLITGIMY